MNGEHSSMMAIQPALDASGAAHPVPEPQPLPEPQRDQGESGFGLGKITFGAIALLALAGIATGIVPFPGFTGRERVPPTTPVAIEEQQPKPQLMPSLIRPVAAADVEQAIGATPGTDADKARLRGEITSGRTRIGWLTVLDLDAEDGDWVTVSSAGVSQQVQLFHAPTTIAVPYAPGAPVTVTGMVDGDGKGITVAVEGDRRAGDGAGRDVDAAAAQDGEQAVEAGAGDVVDDHVDGLLAEDRGHVVAAVQHARGAELAAPARPCPPRSPR